MADLEPIKPIVKRAMRKFKLKPQVPFIPTEAEEQMRVVTWARFHQEHWPDLKLLYAVPNGAIAGPGRYQIVIWMQNMGMVNGVPDLVLPIRRDPYGGLYLEMKRRKGGKLSPEQEWWVEQLRSQNYAVVVPKGADEAIEMIENYLGIKTKP